MSRIELKVTCHIKNQENLNSCEKRQSTDANIERYLMLKLSEKNFRATIKKCSNSNYKSSGNK